ncbi:unnamed protein product [Leuciscus chuanchicus]
MLWCGKENNWTFQALPADASTEDPPEKRTRTGSLLDMYDEILEENVMFEEQDKTASASQVISYLAEPTIPRNHSPLEYWKCNQARFPALATAASTCVRPAQALTVNGFLALPLM